MTCGGCTRRLLCSGLVGRQCRQPSPGFFDTDQPDPTSPRCQDLFPVNQFARPRITDPGDPRKLRDRDGELVVELIGVQFLNFSSHLQHCLQYTWLKALAQSLWESLRTWGKTSDTSVWERLSGLGERRVCCNIQSIWHATCFELESMDSKGLFEFVINPISHRLRTAPAGNCCSRVANPDETLYAPYAPYKLTRCHSKNWSGVRPAR